MLHCVTRLKCQENQKINAKISALFLFLFSPMADEPNEPKYQSLGVEDSSFLDSKYAVYDDSEGPTIQRVGGVISWIGNVLGGAYSQQPEEIIGVRIN
jgi:hypothetical protein